MARQMEDITLKLENGENMRFQGRLFSESSDFDRESGALTRQQLYKTDNGDQVYYIVRTQGNERTRNAYRLSIQGDTCVINNGRMEIAMQFDMLMLAVRSLCGLNADATPSLDMVEEMLREASA